MSDSVSETEIKNSYELIKDHIRKTPVVESHTGDFGLPYSINIKLESLQFAGSFKARGAFNNLLSAPDCKNGFTAASGGNHGAAVAYAAGSLGQKSTIFVPETSSSVKVERIRSYGADVSVKGLRYADAAKLCEEFQSESGAINVHPFDSKVTVAGQGTLGLEWEARTPDLDLVLIAVGGGGLISGVASWYGDRVKVIGVEPEGCPTLHTALKVGRPTDVEIKSVAADSLGARRIGDLNYKILSEKVEEVVLVKDSEILRAQALLWREMQVAAEPGASVSLAALISGAFQPKPNQKVGVLVCGGNVSLKELSDVSTAVLKNL